MIEFRKMHGLGNDFVVIDARFQDVDLTQDLIKRICDRHFGIGCDQLVVIKPAMGEADAAIEFYNGDGSESGACGNATRCVADIVLLETCREDCKLETKGGILHGWATRGGLISVDMGAPRLEWDQIPLAQQADTLHLPLDGDPVGVSMGNPHCVFFAADEAEDSFVEEKGSAIENNPLFPERTNVEFANIVSPTEIRQRTWERGAGITLACGTGACATAIAAMRRGLVDRAQPVQIRLDGGPLLIEWRERDDHVIMTGPIEYVFEGTFRS